MIGILGFWGYFDSMFWGSYGGVMGEVREMREVREVQIRRLYALGVF